MSNPLKTVASDAKTLWHLAVRRAKGKTHAERLENFYSGQAGDYDDFRRRMLHSRQEMIQSIPVPEGGVWVDLGAGTGENAEHIGEPISQLSKMYLIDLSESLLEQAQRRVDANGWTNVTPVCYDATQFVPEEGAADVVTFSYSLTMIPDWFRAIDHAWNLLRPGGVIGVVDFYVSRKHPEENFSKHGWGTRTFWQPWFASDNVFLSPDHLPYLKNKFETVSLSERRGKIPYLPFVRAPHYLFIGKKPTSSDTTDEA
ncbi:Demethylmenaquinone methyltransferase [Thalassoglobus neptunius]|uniref:Demethylmenaquinone methyltransferase n=1 Tax=Thalassoglobus neptunius TaxID=1938619 RepID=A0A5C5X8Y0_9PLAN|nr:class I SAM-dependent methyltransferase [Thalassoglobus neptunius]TWT58605.1 Demethylmenaquinone methyltransferase [Thalassoglobus neptunius]